MPLPEPNDYNNKNDFIQACMEDPVMKTEFPIPAGTDPEESQRMGVCQNLWDRRNE